MLVVDTERSEYGQQRRKDGNGRLLHCCCICGKLEPWGDDWSCLASVKQMDNGQLYPKFCSYDCRKSGGPMAKNITAEMKRKAKDAEWREPETAWREATPREKYDAAAYEQRRKRKPVPLREGNHDDQDG